MSYIYIFIYLFFPFLKNCNQYFSVQNATVTIKNQTTSMISQGKPGYGLGAVKKFTAPKLNPVNQTSVLKCQNRYLP
jgi:hypothetical protein